MKPCRKARALIERSFDSLDVELSLDEEFWVEEHVASCARCRALFERERALVEAIERLPAPPVDRLDVEQSLAQIDRRIDAALATAAAGAPERAESSIPATSWTIRRVAAAAVVLGVFGLWFGRRANEGARPTAPAPATLEGVARSAALERPDPASDAALVLPGSRLAFGGSTGLDHERLGQARTEVRALLLDAAALLPADTPRGGATSFATRFDELAGDLRSARWPVTRMVEVLANDAEALCAEAATRYLGVRAERLSVRVLEALLEDEERERAALRALCDAGDLGLRGVARAIWDPDLHAEAHARAAELEGVAGATWARRAIEALPRRARGAAAELAPSLLPLLASYGEPGTEALLALAGDPLFAEEALLDALATAEGAGAAVVRLTERPRPSVDERFLLRAVERLRPRAALDWVERQCYSYRHRAQAAGVLASYEGTRALLTLFELRHSIDDPIFQGAWQRALDSDDERFVDLAWDRLQNGDRAELADMIELLVLSEREAAVAAMLVLAESGRLADDDRERALLAAGELGGLRHVAELRWVFDGFERDDRALAAACLVAAHRIGGESISGVLLDEARERNRTRILDLLADTRSPGGDAVTLFKLARELEPVLALRDEVPGRATP